MDARTYLKAALLAALACVPLWGEETVPEQKSSPDSPLLLRGDKNKREIPPDDAIANKPEKKNRPRNIKTETNAEVLEAGELIPPPRGEKPRAAEEVDLIGDKHPGTEATPGTATAPRQLLEEMPAPHPINLKARQCYKLVGEIKSNLEKISTGLDDGGKEITMLVRISDDLAQNITDLADLWPEQKVFIDQCSIAKRQALVLNEELDRVPRDWRTLRRSMNSALMYSSKLRHTAKALADEEPKPIATKGKDGKIEYVEAEPPPIDPLIAKREEAVSEARRVREKQRQIEESRKKKQMEIDLRNVK